MPKTVPNRSVHGGDCVEVMRIMAEPSVQTCITRRPYFGLRDYGVDEQIGLEATRASSSAASSKCFGKCAD